MSTAEETKDNIGEVLKIIDSLHTVLISDIPVLNVDKEDIKNYFKMGHFVEKTIENVQIKGITNQFLSVLNKSYPHTIVYDVDFYSHACDHLLSKFLKCKSLNPSILDAAIRMYMTFQSKERLENTLQTLILQTASCTNLLEFVIDNKDSIDSKELESRILLSVWSKELKTGDNDTLDNAIQSMLLSYRIQTSLPVLVKALALHDISNDECKVIRIILDVLVKKMSERSISMKDFWLTFFKIINKHDIVLSAKNHENFFLELCNFIVYFGSMMNKESTWVCDPKISVCPELSYSDLLEMIKYFRDFSIDLKNHMRHIVEDAKFNTGSLLWDDVKLRLNL